MGKKTQHVMGCVLAVLTTGVACSKDSSAVAASGSAQPEPSKSAFAPPTPATPQPDPPSKLEVLLAKPLLTDAIATAKPDMSDTDDEVSPGAAELAVWAAAHLRWSDVAVTKNETSFALVHKDADTARGKRLCVRGALIQIQKEPLGATFAFSGLLLSDYSNIVSFIAVGSTGELVQQSYARFCGVVIGTYDYSNSAGGKGHAVSVVGMFDLPENRKPN